MSLPRVFDDILRDWGEFFSTPTYTLSGTRRLRLIDEDEYDIVPKKRILERQVKEAEKNLQYLKDQKANNDRWYDERIKEASLKLDQLKQKLPAQ